MGGPYLIKMYNDLTPIIKYKRDTENTNGVYEEFEKMVKKLKFIQIKDEI